MYGWFRQNSFDQHPKQRLIIQTFRYSEYGSGAKNGLGVPRLARVHQNHGFLDYFKSKKNNRSASVAKERLQIIVAHERGQRDQPDYLPELQKELLAVIRKYVQISDDQVQVEVDRNDSCSVLELNVTLPEH